MCYVREKEQDKGNWKCVCRGAVGNNSNWGNQSGHQ